MDEEQHAAFTWGLKQGKDKCREGGGKKAHQAWTGVSGRPSSQTVPSDDSTVLVRLNLAEKAQCRRLRSLVWVTLGPTWAAAPPLTCLSSSMFNVLVVQPAGPGRPPLHSDKTHQITCQREH